MLITFSPRYEQEQAMVQEELLQLAKRERDAARERLNATLQQERISTNEEKQKTAQLVSPKKDPVHSLSQRLFSYIFASVPEAQAQ